MTEMEELIHRVRKDGSVHVASKAKAVGLVEAALALGYTFGRRQTVMGWRVLDLDGNNQCTCPDFHRPHPHHGPPATR